MVKMGGEKGQRGGGERGGEERETRETRGELWRGTGELPFPLSTTEREKGAPSILLFNPFVQIWRVCEGVGGGGGGQGFRWEREEWWPVEATEIMEWERRGFSSPSAAASSPSCCNAVSLLFLWTLVLGRKRFLEEGLSKVQHGSFLSDLRIATPILWNQPTTTITFFFFFWQTHLLFCVCVCVCVCFFCIDSQ